MQNNMIIETRNGKTSKVWLECLIFILIFYILETVKGIFTIIPMIIEILKNDLFDSIAEDEVSGELILEFIYTLTSAPSVIITMLFSCAVTILGVIIYCKKIRKRSYASIGIVRKSIMKNYLIGSLIGAGLLVVIYLILFICGNTGSINFNGFSFVIILFLIGFIIQSASEEFLMRGYFMNSVAARSNIAVAVILNSVIFMVLHLTNPGVTFISMLNILIIGMVFSLLFLLSENIWMVSGMHFFWNFASGCLLGSNVSGMEISSLFTIPLIGNELFTGGKFGIEGSIVTTIVTCALSFVLFLRVRKAKIDIKSQESQIVQHGS